MFKSFNLVSAIDPGRTYRLVDTDFIQYYFIPHSSYRTMRALVAVEYDKRDLNVGKNLALYALFMSKTYGIDIKLVIGSHMMTKDSMLEEGYPISDEKWALWMSERDNYLAKLVALK